MARYFHITPQSNLEAILMDGLIPSIGERSLLIGEKVPAVYIFNSTIAVEDALMNWLTDYFDESIDLALIEIISEDNIELSEGVEYESKVLHVIHANQLHVLSENVMDEICMEDVFQRIYLSTSDLEFFP